MYKLTQSDVWLATSAITLSIIYTVWSTLYNGFLPEPMFYAKSDTFMDFYHLQYWTYNAGRYTEWKSIYTPFSFFLVSLFTDDLPGGPFDLRHDSVIPIIGFFLVAICLIIYFQVKLFVSGNKWLWTAILLTSSPFLFTIERGNVLLYALCFLLISIINYKRILFFCFFLALAASIKIYLIALLFIPVLNLQIFRATITLFLFILINVISGVLLDDSNWLLFLQNITDFSSVAKHYEWSYFSYSYQNMLSASTYLHPRYEFIGVIANIFTLSTVFLLFGLVSIRYLFLSKHLKQKELNSVAALLLMLIMIVVKNSGGYVFILLFPFLTAMILNRSTFFMFLLLLVPLELNIIELDVISHQSYLSGDQVSISRNITLGMVVRPILFLTLYVYLSIKFLLRRNVIV